MSPNLIAHFKHVYKTFIKEHQPVEVLRDCNFEVFEGQSISVVGKSGSGKSTFLQILGSLDKPTKGEISLFGKPLQKMSSKEINLLRNRDIGFVFQFHHLLPDQPALYNCMMPAIIAGDPIAQAQKEARKLLDEVGLSHRLHHSPSELSGGEQQRVAIARALIRKPKLLLVDEPTGNLDPKTSTEIMNLLIGLNRDRKSALVMVTHDMNLARLCERHLLLKNGTFEPASEPLISP
jgi:lipoprotein-releasing system ATP-binding protein